MARPWAAAAADNAAKPSAPSPYLSPAALAADADGKTAFVACATSDRVAVVDVPGRKLNRFISVEASPTGLAVSRDGSRLFVTCAAPRSRVCVVDTATDRTIGRIETGHTAMAPVLSPNEDFLYVSCQFDDAVAVIDLRAQTEVGRIRVRRQPVAAARTHDGKFLLVANLLPDGRADGDFTGAVVSVIDTLDRKVIKEIPLPNGSGQLHGLGISPDGKFAVVTHLVARFHLPVTQLERGWVNTNAKTIVDVQRLEVVSTVLLDGPETGAANPWGLAWTPDGGTLIVTQAGMHDLSVVDFTRELEALGRLAAHQAGGPGPSGSGELPVRERQSGAILEQPVNDLAFLGPFRRRIRLPEGDRGPRAVWVANGQALVANYFSDTLTVVDLRPPYKMEGIALSPAVEMDAERLGELYFHDAGICFQGWQSCASCHPGGARADGLNWDLLNDGIGNPKNNKSLLLSHKTPPSMSLGVRDSFETAVRAGIRSSLFSSQPSSVPRAIDAYIKALKPVPSPRLVDGELSAAARRGEKVFKLAGCTPCHPPGLFTNLESYDVGTLAPSDNPEDRFDTPTLVECWRTAPYLHDGSAATMRDVLTTRNPKDKHGVTSKLSPQQLDDLCEYLLSL